MTTKKVCLIGDFGVGKTSLVSQFVHSIFSEKYLTTVGVKIDTKEIKMRNGKMIKLVIWDIAGTSALSTVEQRYLRGASGYILVVDGTRRNTLDIALELDKKAQEQIGEIPRIMVFNKADLKLTWEVETKDINSVSKMMPVRICSALSDDGVEDLFVDIAENIASI